MNSNQRNQSLIKIPRPIEIPLSQIQLDETNPNEMTDDMFNALGKSLNKLGVYDTILVGKPNDKGIYTVKNGNHRIKSLRDNGVSSDTKVWAFSFDGDESELTLLRQSLNKTHGRHDPEKDLIEYALLEKEGQLDILSELLAKPKEHIMDYRIEQTPLTTNYHDERHEDARLTKDEFNKKFERYDALPTPKESTALTGQVYQLGRHKISCGDAKINLDSFIGSTKVNLLFADPPYGISIVKKDTVGGGKIDTVNTYRKVIGDDEPFDPRFLLEYGDTQIIFGANHFASLLPQGPGWLVWNKTRPEWKHTTFADCEILWTNQNHTARIYTQVWRGMIRDGETSKKIHPTQKPVRLLSEIIMDYSKENDIVLDPFLGSGSTLMACEDTGRTCYGMEIDPLYIDDIIERWQKHTGLKAKLEVSP